MEAFFSGTVIIIYLIAHYASEIVFVAACCLPTLYGITALFLFRFGADGRLIVARKRAKKMTRRGVISGEKRAAFYNRCVKNTPAAFRAAYSLFLDGKLTGKQVALVGVESVRGRKGMLRGGSVWLGIVACLSVFLTFYFIVPIGETLLRATICGMHAAIGSLVLHFVTYGGSVRAEKAACEIGDLLDGSFLREKKVKTEIYFAKEDEALLPLEEKASKTPDPTEEEALHSLRNMLRELEGSAL